LISYIDTASGLLWTIHCGDQACNFPMPGPVPLLAVAPTGNPAENTSITTSADGLGLISFYNISGGAALWIFKCANATCTAGAPAVIDATAPGVGQYNSITLGSDGLGMISYYDSANDALKVAHCQTVACGTADLYTMPSMFAPGGIFTSITIGVDDLALISFIDSGNTLQTLHCSNEFCIPFFRRQ
jgi:hypothetical protein